jgi:hypothetical protein
MKNRRNLVAGMFAVLLCGAGCSSLRPDTVPAAQGTNSQTLPSSRDIGSFLYVGGGKLSKYDLGSSKPLRDVSAVYLAVKIDLDVLGNVFLLENFGSYTGQIFVFSAQDLTLQRELTFGQYLADVVADSQGYLYVSAYGHIWVYTPGGADLIVRIRAPGGALAFDSSGNLYSGAGHDLAVYAPTKAPGHLMFVRDIHDGIDAPSALAFGPSGELFVANSPYGGGRSSVSVFAAGGSKPELRIFNGVSEPRSVAVDSSGILYVANRAWVTVYAPGGTKPVRRIAKARYVGDLAIDASNNVYVADGKRVDVYAQGGTKLLYTIAKGINGADVLAIGKP